MQTRGDDMERTVKIVHQTFYEFNYEVLIEPHYLRFKPRVTPHNKLESADIAIFPTPVGLSEQGDMENNLVHFCWFDGMHKQLNVQMESVVTMRENNPFEFMLFPDTCTELPLDYSCQLKDTLHAALVWTKIGHPLIDYGNEILQRSTYNTLDFLSNLTNQIHNDFIFEYRQQGEPFDADITFSLKRGSCRDLAWMQIILLRHLGIAARFVSGYYFVGPGNGNHELHGWLEVYLPGAGWIGFDPSNGMIAGSSHIPICSSAYYQNTMPITGSFRGGIGSSMVTSLSIEEIQFVTGNDYTI